MKLSEYFEETGIPITRFAKRIKVSPATLHNALNGKNVSLQVAIKIEKGTGGKVTCQDLVSPE